MTAVVDWEAKLAHADTIGSRETLEKHLEIKDISRELTMAVNDKYEIILDF
jgi:hypothetical protein